MAFKPEALNHFQRFPLDAKDLSVTDVPFNQSNFMVFSRARARAHGKGLRA